MEIVLIRMQEYTLYNFTNVPRYKVIFALCTDQRNTLATNYVDDYVGDVVALKSRYY